MLAVSPRVCERFVQMQEMITEFSTFRLNLKTKSKDLLNEIAVKNDFYSNPAYISLIESLFLAGLSEISLCQ
jgi:hypothetical protein